VSSTKGNRQVGIVIIKDGQVIGLEAFDHPETFKQHKDDLYKKYALDIATKSEKADENPSTALAKLEQELEQRKVTKEQHFNIGGENIYIETQSLRGSLFRRGAKTIVTSIIRK